MNHQPLFDYMSKQHGVDLLETEMIEIVRIVNEIQKPEEPQPKTIRQWFEELPEPYRGEAMENCKALNGDGVLNSDESLMSDSLRRAFTWDDTKQGGQYWLDLHDKLLSENK